MLPGDTDLDKILRRDVLSFLELFREGSLMMIDYDKDVPTWYNDRHNILALYKQLQHDYLIVQQKVTIFKHQLVQLKDKMQKIENEPPLWEAINNNRTKINDSYNSNT